MNQKTFLLWPLFLLLLSGCQSQILSQPQQEELRIGVAVYQQDDVYIASVVQQLTQILSLAQQEEGKKITLTVVDAKSNQTSQNIQVDTFLNQDYHVVCVNIVDRTAAAVLVDKAKSAQIPILFFNREPVAEDLSRWEQAYYVGFDAIQGGALQGDLVGEAWSAPGGTLDKNGDDVLQYVMLEGEPGHQDALLRTEYSIKALTGEGIVTERLASDTANWQRSLATPLMKRWIELYGSQIEVVFSNNDDMALGAIDAYLALGYGPEDLPFFVGTDATAPALKAMEEGLLHGTVDNNARLYGETLWDHISLLGAYFQENQGQLPEKYTWLPSVPLAGADFLADT